MKPFIVMNFSAILPSPNCTRADHAHYCGSSPLHRLSRLQPMLAARKSLQPSLLLFELIAHNTSRNNTNDLINVQYSSPVHLIWMILVRKLTLPLKVRSTKIRFWISMAMPPPSSGNDACAWWCTLQWAVEDERLLLHTFKFKVKLFDCMHRISLSTQTRKRLFDIMRTKA